MVARPQAQQNVARCRDGANVLKSVNVNDLHGFCVDRLAPLFAWTGPPPCSYGFSARWFAVPFRDTLPCFWRKHFYTPLYCR